MSPMRSLVFLLTALTAAACGGNQGTHPDDMSAEDHRRAAGDEEQVSTAHEGEYDPDARSTVPLGSPSPTSEAWYGLDVYNPTAGHLVEAQQHEDLAAEHRAAAATLEHFEQAECAQFPAETRASCPLMGQVARVTDVDGGVRIELIEGTNRDAVADHMRCHVAYARTQGREGMSHCPLYVEGASVGSDGALTLTTNAGPAAVTDLRRRARAHAAR